MSLLLASPRRRLAAQFFNKIAVKYMKAPIYTEVPGFESIELVSYYDNFKSYYPKCELETKRWFVENVKEDWVILDCGANIGYYSILFAKLASNGWVFAFEPTDTIQMCEVNIRHHNIKNVTLVPMALGKNSGIRTDSIYKIWGSAPEQKVYLFTTLDDFIETKKIEHVDCIKIDVDSFDFEVLQGCERFLLKYNPFIMVELNHALAKRQQGVMNALEWMCRRGYTHVEVYDSENFLFKKGSPEITHRNSINITFPNDKVDLVQSEAEQDHV